MNKAEWYAQRMINYLMDNPSHFPEYPLSDGTHSNIRAKKSAYTGGMFWAWIIATNQRTTKRTRKVYGNKQKRQRN